MNGKDKDIWEKNQKFQFQIFALSFLVYKNYPIKNAIFLNFVDISLRNLMTRMAHLKIQKMLNQNLGIKQSMAL